MSIEQLRFPSGRTVKKIKQDAKKRAGIHTDILNSLSKENGLDMPWDKAIPYLKDYWSSWFAVHIFQEDAPWQIDVRYPHFKTQAEAEAYAKTFNGSLKWVGGERPLVLVNDKTGEAYSVNSADVRLWRVKKESENKIMVTQGDMERVYTSISEWPRIFGNDKPRFDSLAYGVEYGDDDGLSADQVAEASTDALASRALIDRMGIKIRADQSGKRVFQVYHPYDVSKQSHYVLVNTTKLEVEKIIATVFYLCEFEGLVPSYYSGGINLTARFVIDLLSDVYKYEVIHSDYFNHNRLSDKDDGKLAADGPAVDVLNLFEIMQCFDKDNYELSDHIKIISSRKADVISIFRRSMLLPENFDEAKWMLVNINAGAVEREEVPLTIENLSVNDAWSIRHKLEEAVFTSLANDIGLSRDDNFSEIYHLYTAKTNENSWEHTYPIYRVRHKDFEFNAS